MTDITARYTVTGQKMLTYKERLIEEKKDKAWVKKAIKTNAYDMIVFRKKTKEEVIDFLIRVESFDKKAAEKLTNSVIKKIQKKFGGDNV